MIAASRVAGHAKVGIATVGTSVAGTGIEAVRLAIAVFSFFLDFRVRVRRFAGSSFFRRIPVFHFYSLHLLSCL
jgi:hypothetical protein